MDIRQYTYLRINFEGDGIMISQFLDTASYNVDTIRF